MIQYYIKEVKGQYTVKEKNSNKIHNTFSTKKQAEDKVKRLIKKSISNKSKQKEDKTLPKDMSNNIPTSIEVQTIMMGSIKDDSKIKKLKLKKKLNDLARI